MSLFGTTVTNSSERTTDEAIIGREYRQMYDVETASDVIIGAMYLLKPNYGRYKVVIAKRKQRHYVMDDSLGPCPVALVNPVVQEGDAVFILAGDRSFEYERTAYVTEVRDDGQIAVKQGRYKIIVSHWVLHGSNVTLRKSNIYDPKRRETVLAELSSQAIARMRENSYRNTAKDFFTTFDLPRPPVPATAVVDLTKQFNRRGLDYSARDDMDSMGIDSLRKVVVSGRAKIEMEKSECRCKEITLEEVEPLIARRGRAWKVERLHRVFCLWCEPEEQEADPLDAPLAA